MNNNTNKQVACLLQKLFYYNGESKPKNPYKALLVGIIIFYAVILFLAYYKYFIIALFVMLFMASYMLALVFRDILPEFKPLFNPVPSYTEQCIKIMKDETPIVDLLNNTDIQVLRQTKSHLDFELKTIDHRLNFFLGKIGSVGIVAAFLGSVFALFKATTEAGIHFSIFIIVLALFIGLFLGAFSLLPVIVRFKRVIYLIEQVILGKESKPDINSFS